MKIKFILSLTILFTAYFVFSQGKVKYFDLNFTDKKIDNSLYNDIKLLDSREDTSNLGLVRLGLLDKEAAVLLNGSFETQLGVLLTKMNGTSVASNQLVFQLRRLKFVEKAEARKEFGYCFFRANLFTPVQGGYKLISAIDTFIAVESNDVTKQVIEKANKTIVAFVKNALTKDIANASVLSINEVVKIDSIEKLKIKVYNTNDYVNGIYCTFEAFKNQQPDFTLFSITFEDGEISEVKAKNEKGRLKKVSSENVYAIVNKGTPYISAQFGFYPLVKNNNDFYFIGDDKINYIKGQIVKSNSLFNNSEYVYSPLPITSVYEIKIDHVNGRFMRVKEIK